MANHPVTKYLAPARASFRYAAIADVDVVKTAVATSLVAATYAGVDLNGAFANPGPARTKMHRLSVSTAAEAACYNTTDPIVATCTDQQGNARTLVATLTAAAGNETIEFTLVGGADAGALAVVSIAVPAQLKNSGAFTFGVTDVVFDTPCRQLRCGAAGDIVVGYEAETTSGVKLVDTLTGVEGERHDVGAKRIITTGTTAFPVTAYL